MDRKKPAAGQELEYKACEQRLISLGFPFRSRIGYLERTLPDAGIRAVVPRNGTIDEVIFEYLSLIAVEFLSLPSC